MNSDEAWRYNNAQRARRNGLATAVRYNSGYDADHWLQREHAITRARDKAVTALRQSQGGKG